jgi:DNA repair exonuclease SbcCD ATPase subunit
LKARAAELVGLRSDLARKMADKIEDERRLRGELEKLRKRMVEARESLYSHRMDVESLHRVEGLLARVPASSLLKKSRRRLVKVRQAIQIFRQAGRCLEGRLERLNFCEQVLSREGLVNYLYGSLCERLNPAAEKYSRMFCDGLLTLRFTPYTTRKDGRIVNEFDVQIVNVQGGEGRKDQSRGEEQIASLVCILALRSVGPSSNLLILDEPAEGLEPVNAARLAEGIERLSREIPVILLATHNESLKARFSGGESIRLEKRGGVSRIVGN